jgi:hypothetical protein
MTRKRSSFSRGVAALTIVRQVFDRTNHRR